MIRRICPPHLSADEYGQILAQKFDTYRAAVLREAADRFARQGKVVLAASQVAAGLRRMADEAQQDSTQDGERFGQPETGEAPISRAHVVAYGDDGTTKCVDDCPECAARP
jgi:hypothetical protein